MKKNKVQCTVANDIDNFSSQYHDTVVCVREGVLRTSNHSIGYDGLFNPQRSGNGYALSTIVAENEIHLLE